MVNMEALRALLNDIADVKPNKKKSHKYNGDEITHHSVLGHSDNISDAFKKENIEYDAERGRDKVDIFIQKVFHLGISYAKTEMK